MDLKREIEYAYGLISKRFGVKFAKPKVVIGDENSHDFIEINSMKDLLNSYFIHAVYDDKTDTFFIQDHLLGEEDEYDRIYAITHELAHSLSYHVRGKIFEDILNELKKNGKIEQSETLIAFDEGLADYIAIEACKNSGDRMLIKKAEDRENEHERSLNMWKDKEDRTLVIMADVYEKDVSDWKGILSGYLKRNKGIITLHSYYLGYNFVSLLKPENILDLIKNPPQSFKELLYPKVYAERAKE